MLLMTLEVSLSTVKVFSGAGIAAEVEILLAEFQSGRRVSARHMAGPGWQNPLRITNVKLAFLRQGFSSDSDPGCWPKGSPLPPILLKRRTCSKADVSWRVLLVIQPRRRPLRCSLRMLSLRCSSRLSCSAMSYQRTRSHSLVLRRLRLVFTPAQTSSCPCWCPHLPCMTQQRPWQSKAGAMDV